MFDDVDKNNSDQKPHPTDLQNDNMEQKGSRDQQGQKMTDSPFEVKDEENNSANQEREDTKQEAQSQENSKSYSANPAVSRKPGLNQEEPEDIFASVEKNQESDSSESSKGSSAINSDFSESSNLPQEKDNPAFKKRSKESIAKYVILGVLALVVIGGATFWGSNVLLSPGGDDITPTSSPKHKSKDDSKDDSKDTNNSKKDLDIPPPEPRKTSTTTSTSSIKDKTSDISSSTKDKDSNGDEKDSDSDNDQDGLTDSREKQVGTDPYLKDTDGDGLTDKEEVMDYDTNPLKKDTDGDGLTDFEEVKEYNSDPRDKDTDGDGFEDGEEVENGYDPAGEGKL